METLNFDKKTSFFEITWDYYEKCFIFANTSILIYMDGKQKNITVGKKS